MKQLLELNETIFLDNFDEWFEEIKEQPTNSIHWKPKRDERYWFMSGGVFAHSDIWLDHGIDMDRYSFGNVYRTEAECQKAIYRQKAITTLQRSSDFVPDWDDLEEKRWTVCYDYRDKELFAYYTAYIQHGAVAHFRTLDDAEDSIKNHEKEWLIYFGVEDN